MQKRLLAIIATVLLLCSSLLSCASHTDVPDGNDRNTSSPAQTTDTAEPETPPEKDKSELGVCGNFQTWYVNPRIDAAQHVLMLDDHLNFDFVNGLSTIGGYSLNRISNGPSSDGNCLDMSSDAYLDMLKIVISDYTYQAAFIATNCLEDYASVSDYITALDLVITMIKTYQPNIKLVFMNFSLFETDASLFDMLEKHGCAYWDCRFGYTADDFSEDAKALILPDEIDELTDAEKPEGHFDSSIMAIGRESTCEWLIGVVHDVYRQNDKPRILIIGDSICWGYHADVQAELGDDYYVDVVANSFDSADPQLIPCINILLENYDYDIVHFNVGIHTSPHEAQTSYRENVYNILKTIRDNNPDTRVVFATTTTVTRDNSPSSDITQLNQWGSDAAEELGLLVDDLYTLVIRERPQKGDQYHFSDQGPIARQIAQMCRDILNGEYD